MMWFLIFLSHGAVCMFGFLAGVFFASWRICDGDAPYSQGYRDGWDLAMGRRDGHDADRSRIYPAPKSANGGAR